MPTGYTAELVEKGQSFEDFTLLCARAFGACIMQRDDPMKDKPKLSSPTEYHTKEINQCLEKLKQLESKSPAERKQYVIDKKNENIVYYNNCIKRIKEENQRIYDMTNKVMLWNPPTSEHVGLKTFMLEQLNVSIQETKYYEEALKEVTDADPDSYFQDEINAIKDSINYHKKSYIQSCDNSASRNNWIIDLYKSLGITDFEKS